MCADQTPPNANSANKRKQAARMPPAIAEGIRIQRRSVMQEATDRVPPIHPTRRVKFFLELLTMFLPKLIGKEKCDDQKRHNQKRA